MGGRVDDISEKDAGIRVLVVEANAKEAAAVRKSLRASSPNFVISPARQLWSASQILAGMPIDAVLLGLKLPDCDGISAFVELREQSPNTAMLIMGDSKELGQQAVEAGADDYLSHDELEPHSLGMRVIDAIERRRQQTRSQQTELEPQADAIVETSSASILIVEEDPWVQRLLRRNLTRRGYCVEVVSSPQDALAWLQAWEDQLDLLICDVHPLGMESARLSGHLRKRFPKMVTLLVSANTRPPDVVSEQPESFAFLSKPYTFEDFQDMVDKLTEGVASVPV
jgi:DNA-binding response OmpR family regulator